MFFLISKLVSSPCYFLITRLMFYNILLFCIFVLHFVYSVSFTVLCIASPVVYHITTSVCSRQENTLIYKVVTLDAMKAHRRGRGTAPLIPNLGTGFRTRAVLPPVKNPEHASSFRRRRQTFLLTKRYNSRWADTRDFRSGVVITITALFLWKYSVSKQKQLSAQVSKQLQFVKIYDDRKFRFCTG